jgi:asparagine synthase (glutamine-hydrolysing)
MCGITGFWSARDLPGGSQQHLEAMMETLDHRGPDGRGHFVRPQEGIAMGHTRLSINDLADTGAQPLLSGDRRYVLTHNGEFYDFKRYRARTMAEGARFASKSDSEIAISLYERHGLGFVEHLRGEFAFALYDRKKEELLLVRDRFGVRPLFYRIENGMVMWGSEVKSILAHPATPRRLDRRALLNQLMHTMVPGTSAFEGVYALKPGHMLVLRRRDGVLEVESKRYWDLDFPTPEERDAHLAPDDHIEAIREQLVDAIVFRLEADVPVGCYLSGGIDSCSILGLATGAQQAPVKAFTIAFDHDAYDESTIAREMAESMHAEQEMIRLGADELYGDNYVTTAWHAERTFYNTLGVAKWCMSRRVRECGYKTVITGEGSDELFGGYPAFKRDMFLHGLDEEPEDVRRAYQAALDRSNKLFKGAILAEEQATHPAWERLCGFTPSWLQPWLATLEVVRPLLSAEVNEELVDYDPVAAIAEEIDPKMLQGRHPLDRAQYTWVKTMLEGQILNWGGDRVDMANSMESRPAFLDHHLAEAAIRVPPRLRIRGNTEKWVLREAVKGVLPEVLYKREKFAFMAPPAHTDAAKTRGLKQLVARFLNRDAVTRAGLLDPERMETFLQSYWADEDAVSLTRKDAVLNHLLCVQILEETLVQGG